MGVVGQQDFWVAGSRLYLMREDDTYSAMIDLGVLGDVTPNFNNEELTLEDGDGGRRRVVDRTLVAQDESYTAVVRNMSLANLALLYSGLPTEEFTQAATPVLAVAHTAVKGPMKYIKIATNASTGILGWVFNVASIVVKNLAGSTTYVEGTDYKWISKTRGLIQILSGSVIYEGQPLAIDVTPNAVTGKRLVRPQTASTIRGRILMVWSRGGSSEQETVRSFNATITPAGANTSISQYSEMTFNVTVLSDATELTYPAGKLLQAYGSIPATPSS